MATIEERIALLESSIRMVDVVMVDNVARPVQIINFETVVVPEPAPEVMLNERVTATEDALLAMLLGG